MRWPESAWPTPAGPDPTPARTGQIELDSSHWNRPSSITGATVLHRQPEFRPYRWMDPARETARRALPAGLRKLLADRARPETPTTTAA
jgi:hypothetical protein